MSSDDIVPSELTENEKARHRAPDFGHGRRAFDLIGP